MAMVIMTIAVAIVGVVLLLGLRIVPILVVLEIPAILVGGPLSPFRRTTVATTKTSTSAIPKTRSSQCGYTRANT